MLPLLLFQLLHAAGAARKTLEPLRSDGGAVESAPELLQPSKRAPVLVNMRNGDRFLANMRRKDIAEFRMFELGTLDLELLRNSVDPPDYDEMLRLAKQEIDALNQEYEAFRLSTDHVQHTQEGLAMAERQKLWAHVQSKYKEDHVLNALFKKIFEDKFGSLPTGHSDENDGDITKTVKGSDYQSDKNIRDSTGDKDEGQRKLIQQVYEELAAAERAYSKFIHETDFQTFNPVGEKAAMINKLRTILKSEHNISLTEEDVEFVFEESPEEENSEASLDSSEDSAVSPDMPDDSTASLDMSEDSTASPDSTSRHHTLDSQYTEVLTMGVDGIIEGNDYNLHKRNDIKKHKSKAEVTNKLKNESFPKQPKAKKSIKNQQKKEPPKFGKLKKQRKPILHVRGGSLHAEGSDYNLLPADPFGGNVFNEATIRKVYRDLKEADGKYDQFILETDFKTFNKKGEERADMNKLVTILRAEHNMNVTEKDVSFLFEPEEPTISLANGDYALTDASPPGCNLITRYREINGGCNNLQNHNATEAGMPMNSELGLLRFAPSMSIHPVISILHI